MARIAIALEAPLRVDYGKASVLLQRLAAGDRPDLVVLPKRALIRYLHGPVAAQAIEASGMRRIP